MEKKRLAKMELKMEREPIDGKRETEGTKNAFSCE
ncbi:uncharacterized protein G2W53_000893 [Senna tora]|uniref:Uncharacterized protein n=1 Tax=Senna tora TaxID=362788 RepID=A0A834XIP9_9FABA|nr:uncharacterized protein G2W53_000893 [Senna tora]